MKSLALIQLDYLLKKREKDKKNFEDNISVNMKKMVLPYIKKLETSTNKESQKFYVDEIKKNFADIANPFINKLSSKYSSLTPKEIQIALLIKEGRTTKEISLLLNVARGTIEFHRNSLRKKLGLTNTSTNLRSYLLSIK